MITALAALAVIQANNVLTPHEVHAGWKLLFDGKTTKGWHNFKQKTVGEGWVVKDGVLTSEHPESAGDILTDEQFDWFELTMDFNYAKGQNSGVMFHVLDSGDAPWHSGPEIQIYDSKEKGQQLTGFLYQLYSSETDAAKPAGEWNSYRIIITPKLCETYLNGVKYYEYVLGSEDFWARVKKSKFSEFPEFAKANKGHIAIQGDHGTVSFRNIKIRPIHAR